MSEVAGPSFFFGHRTGTYRLIGLSVLVTLICAVLAHSFDRDIALAIREGLDKETRTAFLPVTDLGKADWYIALLLLTWIVGRAGFLKAAPLPVARAWYDLSRMAGFMMASLAFAAVVVHTLKLTVGRARPKALFREDIYGAEPLAFNLDLNSFPSGHSQTVWCLATALILLFPRAWPLLVLWAGTIASSRIIVGAHFPSDVLMGSFIAICSVLFVHYKWYGDLQVPNFKRHLAAAEDQAS